MLKQQARLFTKLSITLDAVILVVAFFATYGLLQTLFHRLKALNDYAWVLLYILPLWLLLLSNTGIYSSMRVRKFGEIFWDLFKVHVVGGMVLTSVIFLVQPPGFSRRFVGTFVLLSFVLMTAAKSLVKYILNYYRRKGFNTRNVLIIGSGENAAHFATIIKEHAHWGLVVIGYFPFGDNDEPIPDCANLGTIDSLPDFCKHKAIDEVVLSLSPDKMHLVDNQIFLLQEMGITVRMIIEMLDIPSARKELTLFHNELPILTFHSKTFDAEQLFFKRCMDVVGSLVGLFITGLMLPFIALAIRMESKGPLFFRQDRVGQNGRIFKCWKLRSMFVDAEQRKVELLDRNEMSGPMFKIKDDPRVTRVGAFIRKTSIDELPQFWNVLRGDMSLVGTRPPTPDEVATYQNWQRKRICIKPGITGLWQVSGRNQIQDFDAVVRLDIRYIEEWSIWLDIKILAKTVWVVFTRQGAS